MAFNLIEESWVPSGCASVELDTTRTHQYLYPLYGRPLEYWLRPVAPEPSLPRGDLVQWPICAMNARQKKLNHKGRSIVLFGDRRIAIPEKTFYENKQRRAAS